MFVNSGLNGAHFISSQKYRRIPIRRVISIELELDVTFFKTLFGVNCQDLRTLTGFCKNDSLSPPNK